MGGLGDLAVANATQHLTDPIRIVLVHLAAESDERVGGHGKNSRAIPAGRQASTLRPSGTCGSDGFIFVPSETASFPRVAPAARPRAA